MTPHSPLQTACRLFQKDAEENPFDTWLIVENEDIRRRAFSEIQSPVLETRITTVKTLAHTLIKEHQAKLRIIPPEEQYLLFLEFAKEVFGRKSATKTLTENLIDLYITLTLNNTKCPKDTEKGQKAAAVFSRYEDWCLEKNAADAISAIRCAVPFAEKEKPASCICFQLKSITPLAETLLCAFAPDAFRIEPEMPEQTLPETAAEILAYKNLREEISQTLEKICRLEESGIPGSDIAVLVPSLQTMLPLFEEMAGDFFVSRELPLTFKTSERKSIQNLPLIRSVLAWAAASYNPKESDLALILDCPEFPYRRSGVTSGKLRKAVKMTGSTAWRTLQEKLDPLHEKEWQKLEDEKLQTIITDILDTAESRQKTCRTLKERIRALRADLHDLGWTDAPLTRTGNAARTAFLRLLDRLEAAGTADKPVTPAEFFAVLSRGCRKNAGIPYPENETAFGIGKLRSAAGTRTPYVFILGLTAKSIPNISATLPLLTVQETKQLLPDRYRKSAEDTAYYFAEALRSAKTALYLSYAKLSGKNSESPSPYLTRLAEAEPAVPLPLEHAVSGNQRTAGHLIAERKPLPELFGVDVREAAYKIQVENVCRYDEGEYTAYFDEERFAKIYSGEKSVSPTFLESFAACPFAWYLKHHLHLEDPRNFSAENIRIGNVMHKVMERYFRKHDCITEEGEYEAYEELAELLREEMEKTGIKTPSWKAKYLQYVGGRDLKGGIQNILDQEIEFTNEGFVTLPDWLERKVTAVFDGVTVSGIADRVMMRDNEFRVLDYKTGKLKKKNDVDAGKVLQLPIYTEAVARETGMTPHTGIYMRIPPKSRTLEEMKDENKTLFPAGAESMILSAKEKIAEILAEIRAGNCGTAADCNDKYCPFRHICRKGEGGEDD